MRKANILAFTAEVVVRGGTEQKPKPLGLSKQRRGRAVLPSMAQADLLLTQSGWRQRTPSRARPGLPASDACDPTTGKFPLDSVEGCL